jgi:hypothetical protein
LLPGKLEASAGQHLLSDGQNLLASEDAEKTDERDDRRRGGADIDEAALQGEKSRRIDKPVVEAEQRSRRSMGMTRRSWIISTRRKRTTLRRAQSSSRFFAKI